MFFLDIRKTYPFWNVLQAGQMLGVPSCWWFFFFWIPISLRETKILYSMQKFLTVPIFSPSYTWNKLHVFDSFRKYVIVPRKKNGSSYFLLTLVSYYKFPVIHGLWVLYFIVITIRDDNLITINYAFCFVIVLSEKDDCFLKQYSLCLVILMYVLFCFSR